MINHNLLIITTALFVTNIVSANDGGIEVVNKYLESKIVEYQKNIQNNDEINLEEIKILNEKLIDIKKIKNKNQLKSKITQDNNLRKKIIYKNFIINKSRDECEDGYLFDCSGDGDCCPESWIGDGLPDCEDQAWGCDMSCYENDGGDCEENEDDGGGDDGLEECEFFDCAGTPACGYEGWLGDGICDDGIEWGIDYNCEEFDYDEGDCEEGSDDGEEDGCWEDGEFYCVGCELWLNECEYLECTENGWDGPFIIDECEDDGGWDDGGNPEECGEGYLFDCSADGDCCPESWIGDGFPDCEDQAWGCDMSCYDNDGGDCEESEDGGNDGDGGEDGDFEECQEGTVDDCSGDGDCCPEGWIGDGYGDCEDQAYGCDLSCYDNDGGDCEENEDGGEDGGWYECDELGYEDCEWLDYCIWTDEGCAFIEEDEEDCEGLDYEQCIENEYCSWLSNSPDEIDGECVENDWNDDGGDDGEDDSVTTLIIGDSESILGEMPGEGIQYGVEVPLLYISSEPIGGIQFTISDYPDWVTGFEMTSAIEDCFTANFNDVEGSFIGILFSLEGCDLDPVDGPTHFATISYELHEDASWGENVELFFSDAIVSDGLGNALAVNTEGNSINVSVPGDVSSDSEVNVLDVVTLINFILFIENPSDYQFWAGDVNQDGSLNVLDVVIMVDIILE